MHRLCIVARLSAAAPTRQLFPASFCSAHACLTTSSFVASPAETGDDPPGRGGSSGGVGTRGGDTVTPSPPPASSPDPSPTTSSSLDDPLAFLDDLGIGGPGGGDGAGGSRTRPPPTPPATASGAASSAASASWPAVGGGAHRRWDSPAGGGGGGYARGGDAALPDDPMFSQSATVGIPDVEVRRMAAIYRLVREHAAAASGTGPPVDSATNVLLGTRLSPIRTLPRVAPAVLAELRHQLPAADASDVLVSSGAATGPAAGGGGAPPPRDSRAAAEAALWRRVDASTMDPHSFARLVRASALAPGAPASGSDGGVGGVPGVAGVPGAATAPLQPGGVGGGGVAGRRGGSGGGGRSKAATKAAARATCPLSDARGRVEVDYRQVELLRGFINPSGRLLSRRAAGTTAKAQRRVSRAVKTARQMALLNSTIQTPIAYSTEDRGGAGGFTGV